MFDDVVAVLVFVVLVVAVGPEELLALLLLLVLFSLFEVDSDRVSILGLMKTGMGSKDGDGGFG